MFGCRSLKPKLIEINHNLGKRKTKKKNPRTKTMVDEQDGANGGNNPTLPALNAHFVPNIYDIRSCIELPEIPAAHYEIKPRTIQSLPLFNGLAQEDPYAHLTEFTSISSTLKITNFPIGAMKLLLFPFSLRGKTKHWLSTLLPRTIKLWEEMSVAFLKKYFSVGKTLQYRREITTFHQNDIEQLFEAWERFGDLLRKCPHHDIPKWQLVQSFYYGLLPQHRQMIGRLMRRVRDNKG
ncbi:hypothetical protein Dimus_038912 [Dionaea muscipula]